MENVTWVKCPICGESDMKRVADPDGDGGYIHCVNLNCGSNGGTNVGDTNSDLGNKTEETKIVLFKLPMELYLKYADGTLSSIMRNTIDDFITRMKMIGHEAFVLPESFEVTSLNNIPEKRQGDTPFAVFYVDTGNMPPLKARSYMESIKQEMIDHPLYKNSIWLAQPEGRRGTRIEILYI